MPTNYLCKKCCFKTNYFNDIKRHINKKTKCNKNINLINYSDDQILVLSLIPYINDKHSIDIEELKHLNNSNIITKNLSELFISIENIDKCKIKKCEYCFNNFDKICDLRKHIISKCFYNYLINNMKKNKQNKTIIDIYI